jgi:iron complex transport system substrate-binding protein
MTADLLDRSALSPATAASCSDGVTRRAFLAMTAGLAIAGCTDDDGESETAEATERRIEDLFGPLRLPEAPARIIAAEDVTLNNLLAMGVKPIGGFIFADSLIRHKSHLLPSGYVDLRGEGELDLERALSLDPDLLLSLGGTRSNPSFAANCARWKAAMPTFCYEYDFIYEEQVKNNVRELGRALDRPADANALIAKYDQRVRELRAAVIDAGFTDKTVSVIRVRDENTFAVRVGTLESIVFRAIGIPQPTGQQDPTKFQIELTSETLEALNESFALVVYADDDDARGGETSVTEEKLRDHPLWPRLTPVQEGRAVFLPPWNGADLPKAITIMDEIEQHVLPLGSSSSATATPTLTDGGS